MSSNTDVAQSNHIINHLDFVCGGRSQYMIQIKLVIRFRLDLEIRILMCVTYLSVWHEVDSEPNL